MPEEEKYDYKKYQKYYYQINKSRFKKYYQENREQRLDYQAAYHKNSSQAIKEYQQQYYIKNRKNITTKRKILTCDRIQKLKIIRNNHFLK